MLYLFSKNKVSRYNIVIFAIIFCCILLMSYNMPYTADDFNFSHVTWSDKRISSISDIIASQKILYMNATGRLFTHFLTQLFLFLNHNIYLICNSLVFCVFIYLIVKLVKLNINPGNIFLVFSFVWLFAPKFGETVIWISGTFNYLWTLTVLLGMFLMYRNIGNIKTIPGYIFMIIISFLSGFSHENTAFLGMSFLFFNLILDRKYIYKKIVVSISFIIGTCLLLLAPGTLNRAKGGGASFSISTFLGILIVALIITIVYIIINWNKSCEKINKFLSIDRPLVKRCIELLVVGYVFLFLYREWRVYNFDTFLMRPQAVIFKFCIISLVINIINTKQIEKLLPGVNFIIIAITSLLPMKVLGEGPIPERSLFPITIMIIISTIMFIKNITNSRTFRILPLIMGIFTIPTLFIVLKFYCGNLNEWNHRLNDVISEAKNSNYNIAILEKQPQSRRIVSNKYMYSPIISNPNAIPNFYTARYYGIGEVIGLNKNNFAIELDIESGDKNNLLIETKEGGNVLTYGNCNDMITPEKDNENAKRVFFELPIGIEKVSIKNNGDETFNITSIKIYYKGKIYRYDGEVIVKSHQKAIISDLGFKKRG